MASYILAGSLIVAVTILVVVAILVKPILFPTVILFPWRDDETKKRNQTVILAGSYNPPHLGHLAMLRYLSQRYEKVIAVVGFNPNKKYPVSPDQRKKLLELMMQSTDSTNVEVAVVDGYIWRYGKRHFVSRFFRGIRSWEKDGSDETSLQILNTWGPLLLGPLFWPIPTTYLEGDPRYNHVASTLIRDLCTTRGSDTKKVLNELVPANIVDEVLELYGTKND